MHDDSAWDRSCFKELCLRSAHPRSRQYTKPRPFQRFFSLLLVSFGSLLFDQLGSLRYGGRFLRKGLRFTLTIRSDPPPSCGDIAARLRDLPEFVRFVVDVLKMP